MKGTSSYKNGWRRAATAIAIGASLCAALALAACGASTQSSSSSASSSAASASSASASATSASAASSQGSAGQKPTEAYVVERTVTNGNDGLVATEAYTYDGFGRLLSDSFDSTSPDATIKMDLTGSEWDEYGHLMKAKETVDGGDGKPYEIEIETTNLDLNEDGSTASLTQECTLKKESFAEGEAASQTVTRTCEYGSDAQVLRKLEVKTELFDQSGKLMMTESKTYKFDEEGLQVSYGLNEKYATGESFDTSAEITWTKDSDGKPASFQIVLSRPNGETTTCTGNVTTDESGLVSRIDNVEVDGKARSTNVTIDHMKIENPSPNAYECWKSFTLTDMILTRE